MATHSSILAWKISWTVKPGGYSPQGHKKSQTQLSDWAHTQMLFTAKPRKVSFITWLFELFSSLVTVKTFFSHFLFALYLLFTFFKCSKKMSVNNFSKFSKTSNYFSHDSPTFFHSVAPTWPGLDTQPLFSSFPLTSSYIELLFPVSYAFFFGAFFLVLIKSNPPVASYGWVNGR